jgi:hypothetical protein
VQVVQHDAAGASSTTASDPTSPAQYIEVTLADIALANTLAHEVLGRSLDELPPQTRRLLTQIDQYVKDECERLTIERSQCRFSRRMLREAVHWGDTQLRVHLERLLELEYLLAHREGPGGKYVYELVYTVVATEQAGEHRAHLAGLMDVAQLQALHEAANTASTENTSTTAKSRGTDPEVAAKFRPDSGADAGMSRHQQNPADLISMCLAA